MALDKSSLDRWFNDELENGAYQERMSNILESLAMKAAVKKLVEEEMSLIGGTGLDILKHRVVEHIAGGARSRPSMRDMLKASLPPSRGDSKSWASSYFPPEFEKDDFFTTGEMPRYIKTPKPEPEPEKLTPVPVTKPPQGFDWT
ncbi:hypothetical protein ACNAUY_07810 [Acinetobacter tibetensis]|uniref:hypothetical protein n=1 Tax=Acinetobacter tibetensis TaxID=2943497 RepID=UPI003A4E3E04